MKNYYKILFIPITATDEEVSAAHRRLSMQFHPDLNPGNHDIERRFNDIQEAYRTLSSPSLRRAYDLQLRSSLEQNLPKPRAHNYSQQEKISLPKQVLQHIGNIRTKMYGTNSSLLNQDACKTLIEGLLSPEMLNELIIENDVVTNHKIINETLKCCVLLDESHIKNTCNSLIQLAGADHSKVAEIQRFLKNKSNRKNTFSFIVGVFIGIPILIIIILIKNRSGDPNEQQNILHQERSAENYSSTKSPIKNYDNGDLNTTFIEEPVSTPSKPSVKDESIHIEPTTTPPRPLSPAEQLRIDGWSPTVLANGPMPSCYNFSPQKSNIDNYLRVFVGSGTDVVIKLMREGSDKCIRYVYINSGTNYSINNIPEGRYYLKIAYGKNWYSNTKNGQCIGKFANNAMYERGEDILDFNLKHTFDGYSVPSYELELDVVSSDIMNSFESDKISEASFNE